MWYNIIQYNCDVKSYDMAYYDHRCITIPRAYTTFYMLHATGYVPRAIHRTASSRGADAGLLPPHLGIRLLLRDFGLHLGHLVHDLLRSPSFIGRIETMFAETMLADLPARAAGVCWCKYTGCTTKKVPWHTYDGTPTTACMSVPAWHATVRDSAAVECQGPAIVTTRLSRRIIWQNIKPETDTVRCVCVYIYIYIYIYI